MQPTTSNADHVHAVPTHPLNESVAARLEALLARVDGVNRAKDIDRPTTFTGEGAISLKASPLPLASAQPQPLEGPEQ